MHDIAVYENLEWCRILRFANVVTMPSIDSNILLSVLEFIWNKQCAWN